MSDQLKSMHDQIDKIHGQSTDSVNADILHRFIDLQDREITRLKSIIQETANVLLEAIPSE